MRPRALLALTLVVCTFLVPSHASARGSAGVAALQVALRAHGVYGGDVDGIMGPRTRAGVRAFQRRHGLLVDGIPGPQTRRALGRRGRPRLGARLVRLGMVGWDVAALQFLLAWNGFPSGSMDGVFGLRTQTAVRRFQRFARIGIDGVVGPGTLRALRGPLPRSPLGLAWPLSAPLTGSFGPRGDRFHAGVDLGARYGAGVAAARGGRVTFAGWHRGGYGYIVVIGHWRRVRTLYAHLSKIHVGRGQRVGRGWHIGHVGSTGASTGPHLHFEVRYRRAASDPLRALP